MVNQVLSIEYMNEEAWALQVMDHNSKYRRNLAVEFLKVALFLALSSVVSFTSNSQDIQIL